jgi:hypothetical protein
MLFFEIFTNIPKRDFCNETFYQQAFQLIVNNLTNKNEHRKKWERRGEVEKLRK